MEGAPHGGASRESLPCTSTEKPKEAEAITLRS